MTDGVANPICPFDVEGLGGECFVGEMPVTAGGKAEAWPASCCNNGAACTIGGDEACRGDDLLG
jgi:hypothetical protein